MLSTEIGGNERIGCFNRQMTLSRQSSLLSLPPSLYPSSLHQPPLLLLSFHPYISILPFSIPPSLSPFLPHFRRLSFYFSPACLPLFMFLLLPSFAHSSTLQISLTFTIHLLLLSFPPYISLHLSLPLLLSLPLYTLPFSHPSQASSLLSLLHLCPSFLHPSIFPFLPFSISSFLHVSLFLHLSVSSLTFSIHALTFSCQQSLISSPFPPYIAISSPFLLPYFPPYLPPCTSLSSRFFSILPSLFSHFLLSSLSPFSILFFLLSFLLTSLHSLTCFIHLFIHPSIFLILIPPSLALPFYTSLFFSLFVTKGFASGYIYAVTLTQTGP